MGGYLEEGGREGSKEWGNKGEWKVGWLWVVVDMDVRYEPCIKCFKDERLVGVLR